MKKTKWFIYTVIVGLLPFLIRLFIFFIHTDLRSDYILNVVDMVTFGLVLHISNINELEDKEVVDKRWKTRSIGFSVIMLIFFSIFLAVAYLSETSSFLKVDMSNFKYITLLLCSVSLLMSASIYNTLNDIE